MRRRWPFVLVLLPFAARAYVMGPGSILDRVVGHRQELRLSSMVARGTFTFAGEDAKVVASALSLPEGNEVSVPAVVSYKAGGRCRVELQPVSAESNVAVLAVANGGRGAVRVIGPSVSSLKVVAYYACPLLDARGHGDGFGSFLRSIGVDTGRSGYGRVGGMVAYVIGATSRSAPSAALWVEKERFEPLRLTVPEKGGGALDLRFVDFSSPIGGEWHPRLIEVRRGADLLGRFAAEKVEPNARLPDALFSPG
jgi:hypothetical protein